LGILSAFPLITLNYVLPVFVGYMIEPDDTKWDSGYFEVIGYDLGSWLGVWMVTASALSNFGQFSSGAAPTARCVWAMAKGIEGPQSLPGFLGWQLSETRPVAAILAVGVSALLFSALPFDFLVQVYLILRLVNLLAEFAAVIYLRHTEPQTPRPYSMPGGYIGVWLQTLPTIIISVVALFTADPEAIYVGGAFTAAIVLSYYFVKVYKQFKIWCTQASSPTGLIMINEVL